MTLDDTGANISVCKIVSFHRQEHGCSSELLRRSASDARIEIKSIPVFQCNVLALHRLSVIIMNRP